ncbi:MAG TPA: lanthionine synthetase LanC family protein [Solirubrobacteraceae bacterium]|nr:lanthionine synthetase LanC family protein [Solirubrobacteraceae bacterium]
MSDALQAAISLGQQLVDEAVWHEGRCNWIGAWPTEGPGGTAAITYTALGPDLYGGTSGIALFLAELFGATSEEGFRRTSLGALRQAISTAPQLPPEVRPALYSGALGIALAAALASPLIDVAELDACTELISVRPVAHGEHDLMSGDAGAVLALLCLATLLDEQALVARATEFGESLLGHAQGQDDTLSWASRALPGEPRLTGLSHGASGCALALLELWQASGETSYLDAARAALAYERTRFDPDAANWPDLRSGAGEGAAEGRRSFAALWCHGAPGIALARLRAVELQADRPALSEARIALDTTRRAVEGELARGGNFSLCHGLAGNAEILLHGYRMLGDERADDAELAHRVATEGIERHGAAGRVWPCGTFEGQATGLFLGLAGIGRFYLRLHDPTLSSLLLPVPAYLRPTHALAAVPILES